MNKQEVFNKVWDWTIVQRKPKSIYGGCMYRSPNGAKCFIGVLIPDDCYDKRIEGLSATDLVEVVDDPDVDIESYRAKIIKVLGDPNRDDIEFLTELQNIHDQHFDFREEKLRELAELYKLKMPV